MEIELTLQNFEQEVINSKIPVLVDFWAAWCGPCQMLAPVVEEIAEEYDDVIKVGKVNVDEQRELSAKYNIESIPTLLVFKDGKIINSSVGFVTKEELIEELGLQTV
ncbi:MAG: thioredoxin [Clostridiales bacterium]|nr:thioredoxin [Clostridiales bacterium]